MMTRKGMMAGSGKRGYYNIIGKDPMVHRQSAIGIKQPQRVQDLPLGKKVKSSVTGVKGQIISKKPFAVRYKVGSKEYVKFTDPKYWKGGKINELDYIIRYEEGNLSDKETLKLFSHLIKNGKAWTLQGHYGRTAKAMIDDGWLDKEGNITKQAKQNLGGKNGFYESAKKYTKKGFDWVKERKATSKAKELSGDSKYSALSDKYFSQKERVETLKRQIADRQDKGGNISGLLKELETEESQFRELQEKVTDVSLETLSDSELKELAIKTSDSSLLSFSGNKYESELLRRISKRKELEQKIKKAESQQPDEQGSIFDF